MGRGLTAPTARVAAWGGLITALKESMPYIPRFDTVKVPPASSGGSIVWPRTFAISSLERRAISPRERSSASKSVGTTSASPAATTIPTFTRE